MISGYGVSKVVSHGVAAPVYGGYHGGYGGYGSYGAYGVSKVVSPVTTLGMCVACSVLYSFIFLTFARKPQSNYHTLINCVKLQQCKVEKQNNLYTPHLLRTSNFDKKEIHYLCVSLIRRV